MNKAWTERSCSELGKYPMCGSGAWAVPICGWPKPPGRALPPRTAWREAGRKGLAGAEGFCVVEYGVLM